jgi:hypothetical protein
VRQLRPQAGPPLAWLASGLWQWVCGGRREVERALTRERIISTADAKPPNVPVRTAAAARSMAEVIRRATLAATEGRTYAETDELVDVDGKPTSDPALAFEDERTGWPIENPQHALWLQSMTLQIALMQAYVSARIAELTIALGVGLTTAALLVSPHASSMTHAPPFFFLLLRESLTRDAPGPCGISAGWKP